MTRADGSPIRVLLVDDEQSLAQLVSVALSYEGWRVTTASEGNEAIRRFRAERPDVVVLDIMLPDIDGLRVLHRMRELGRHTPTLFLTAKDSVDDRILGLAAGGDDYMTKPFSLEELVIRLRGLLRRVIDEPPAGGELLTVGDLSLDEATYEVRRGDRAIALTATEFELLRYFMKNAEHVLSRAQILDNVWNYDFAGRTSIVDLYVSYLRKKIDFGRPSMLHTIRGVGYALRAAS
ncbi:response regulator transcription factor [Pseudoclavibacter endophyticus]|uniref:Response regulator transcription factor n=1 Tax=Pseudoclavibacter endophyticus TaxID=1778590 RepID=A0A6H9WV76_9MICO|nr:response regulator transcription factor [Pseudoclavibacter endophyticus]KAB1650555.1 response regulator transcription factor [Pseudoclavibacter endophyticus]